eukprot:299219-Chlamydomonas_euryale.AAC.2
MAPVHPTAGLHTGAAQPLARGYLHPGAIATAHADPAAVRLPAQAAAAVPPLPPGLPPPDALAPSQAAPG